MPGGKKKIITIDKINGNFFGGLPFVANWSFNDGSTPSTLNVSVVNADGNYSINDNDLSYKNTVPVSLGKFTFQGYLTGYDIEESAQQTILNLEYIDKSIDLERWSVGLNERHGGGDGNPEHMILVGRSYGPCDGNLDSTQLFTNQTSGLPDPCDPCPNMPANGYLNACQDDPHHLKIWPVYYTFNELLSKMDVCGLKIVPPTNLTGAISSHRAQHVGSLKSVLSTWCSELGLAYYFDPVKQELVIVSRAAPISIPEKEAFEGADQVVSLKYGKTRSKTFSRGFISYIGTQGRIKDYECKREDAITLHCLTLLDLVSSVEQATEQMFDPKTGGTYDTGYKYVPPPLPDKSSDLRKYDDLTILVYATILAYYPLQVRRTFLWFEALGIYDKAAATKWIIPYVEPANSVSDAVGTQASTIYELGNMNIVDVIGFGDDGFDKLTQGALPKEYTDYVNADDIKNVRDIGTLGPSYYFIVAQYDPQLDTRQEHRDSTRARGFLGKYYYRSYDKMAVGGGSNDNNQLNIDAAGASATYHPRGEYIQQLPIFSFGHTGKSTIGKIEQLLGADDSDNISSIGEPTGSGTEKYRSLKSFILLDRADAAKFDPHENEFTDWADSWSWYENIAPQMLGNKGRPQVLLETYPLATTDSTLKLFVAREVSQNVYKIKVENNVPNPWESKTPKTRIQSTEGVDGTNSYRDSPADGDTNAAYGLMSPNTVKINMPDGLVIYAPAQSVIMEGVIESQAGFRVFIKSDSRYQKIVPKFQSTAFINAKNTEEVSKVDYIYKELGNDNLESFLGKKQCLPTRSEVEGYVNKFSKEMATTNNAASARANVKVLGVMPLSMGQGFGIPNGLSSVQISVGDNGVFTDYSFEDKIVLPPSDDVIQDEIIRQNRIHPTFGGNLQKMTTQQYADVGVANTQVNPFNGQIKIG